MQLLTIGLQVVLIISKNVEIDLIVQMNFIIHVFMGSVMDLWNSK